MKSKVWNWTRFIVLALAMIPFIGGVSTINGIYGTSAPAALSYDLQEKAPEWREYVKAASADANKANQALDVVGPINAAVCDDAEGALTGRMTGIGGAGPVSAGYAKGCAYTGNVVETLSEMATAQAARRDNLSSLLEQLELVPRDGELSVFERRDRFRMITTEIDAVLSESDAANVAETLKTQMANLNGLVATVPIRPGRYEEVQRASLDALQAYFVTIEETVSDLMTVDAELTSGVVRPGELRAMHEAIFHFRDHLWPAIILAIAIDAAVLWFAIALALSTAILKQRKASIHSGPAWLDLPNLEVPEMFSGKPKKEPKS